jgi:hypothetical protein
MAALSGGGSGTARRRQLQLFDGPLRFLLRMWCTAVVQHERMRLHPPGAPNQA